MRNKEEMMKLIMDVAINDERIRAVTMEGSRASKYLKRFLSLEEMKRFHSVFPNGTYEDIWSKLYVIYDYFAEIAKYVGEVLKYNFDAKETEEVRRFLSELQKQCVN